MSAELRALKTELAHGDIALVKERFATTVDTERYCYLRSLSGSDISNSGPLDLPRKSIVRIAVAENICTVAEAVEIGIQRGESEMLKDALLNHYQGKLCIPHPEDAIKRASYQQFLQGLVEEFPAQQLRKPLQNSIILANEYGRAIFTRGASSHSQGSLRITEIDAWGLADSQILMFYGFNDRDYPNEFFIQKRPIEVLAQVFCSLAQHGIHPNVPHAWWDVKIGQELMSLPTPSLNHHEIQGLCEEFLIAHELGHTFRYKGCQPIIDLAQAAGFSPTDLYMADFPTARDMNAWKRVVAAQHTLRDVTFLLGDMLANMTILIGGLPQNTITALRAFNWWLVTPPTSLSRPRGNITFMVYSALRKPIEILPKLAAIFSSVRTAPQRTAQLMQELELESWNILLEQEGANSR